MPPSREDPAAIVLAGGRGSRLGGLDKSALESDGRPLLAVVLGALAGARPVVVVGPPALRDRLPEDLLLAREDPPFGGPAAALAAGVAALSAEPDDREVVVLAVDLPRAADLVAALGPIPPGADGLMLTDADGRDQPLAARYRLGALRAATGAETAGRSLRAVLGALRLERRAAPAGATQDVDTVADARAARIRPPEGTAMADNDDDALEQWWARLSTALELTDVPADRDAILGLAGVAAHRIVRPAAPLTTFLAGYAAGLAGGSADSVAAALQKARAAAQE